MGHLTIRARPDEKAQDLARRLKARVPGLECRVCGLRDFGLVEDPKMNLRTHLRREPNGGGLASQFFTQNLVTLICTNCGHLEQFAESVLEGATPEQYGVGVSDE